MANHALSIDRVCESQPYFAVLQNRVSQVDANILKRGALMGSDAGICVFVQPGKHVRFDVILQKVNRSLFKLECTDHRVRDDLKSKSRDAWFSFPVGWIGLESYGFSRFNGFQDKWSGAGRRAPDHLSWN